MRNERLFDKIKETARANTTGIEDYDPEKIWASVKNRQDRQTFRLWWWPYAAASVVLLLALSVWILKPQTQQAQVNINVNPDSTSQSKKQTIRPVSETVSQTNEGTKAVSEKPKIESFTKDLKAENSISIHIDTIRNAPPIADITPIPKSSETSANPTNAKTDSVIKKPRIEKVLVADIAFPEQKTDQLTALQRIFDQVKKDREARKMRLQFDRSLGNSKFWSFVQQSFIEYPPASNTASPAKQPETKN